LGLDLGHTRLKAQPKKDNLGPAGAITMAMPWVQFGFCALAICLAGPFLIHYGDIIASKTGISRTWIGLVLLSTATSLPELFTGLSAVTIAAAPNIAVGDALGSCVFNLAMLVVLDALHREKPLYGAVDQGHILAAGFGVVLIGFVGVWILLGRNEPGLQILHVGVYTPIIILIYFVAMRTAFAYEGRKPAARGPLPLGASVSLKSAIVRYLAAAVVVAAAGTWLPFAGVEIADAMGWRTTFVGTLIIAVATSLPELVVTLGALRVGAVDMAMANLLGSNLFDMLIIAIDDLAYVRGPLLAAVSPVHGVTAFAGVIMSGVVIVAVLYRPAARGPVGWVSLSLLLVYLLSAYAVYLHGQ
jgi:cation:H+ antiporter